MDKLRYFLAFMIGRQDWPEEDGFRAHFRRRGGLYFCRLCADRRYYRSSQTTQAKGKRNSKHAAGVSFSSTSRNALARLSSKQASYFRFLEFLALCVVALGSLAR